MPYFLIAFLVAFCVVMITLRYAHRHMAYTADDSPAGARKFHGVSAPRVGGVAIFLGLTVAGGMRWLQDTQIATQGVLLAACALPAFFGGFLEDVRKGGWTWLRLGCTFASAAMAGGVFSAWIGYVGMPFIDSALAHHLIAIAFTCFAVAGVTNSFNLIDGFNGLASGVAVIILAALAYVAYKNGDILVFTSALTAIGAILGFMVWNFPGGLIYLGDCGAYLLGFWVAELSVLLVVRNPQVSPWFPLVLCAYPVVETLFSIYRRLMARGGHPTRADAAHLHHMIYRRLVRWALGGAIHVQPSRRNASTSPYLWLLTSISVLPALLFWQNGLALQCIALLFAVLYVVGYAQLFSWRRSGARRAR